MHMNRQASGFCHPWNCCLGLDDDNLRDGRFPSPSDKSLETDMQDDTRALVVEEGVGLVQWLTMERERERRQRVQDREGRKEVGRDHQAPKEPRCIGRFVVVPVVVDGWLWRDNQGYRPTSHGDP